MYPKTFFSVERSVQPGKMFVAMPFAKEFDSTFACIRKAMEKENVSVVRTDELLGGGHVIADILEGIATSEIVVVDVTARNPNVFYELGIAHMCKEVGKVILLSQDIESIPFDLRTFRYVLYSPDPPGLRVLSDKLRESVRAVRQQVHRIFLSDACTGALPQKLMGLDHCLYSFEVLDGFRGHDAAKFLLQVERHIMGERPRHEEVFRGGMGLQLGESRSIVDSEWNISFERAPDGRHCLTISRNDRSKGD